MWRQQQASRSPCHSSDGILLISAVPSWKPLSIMSATFCPLATNHCLCYALSTPSFPGVSQYPAVWTCFLLICAEMDPRVDLITVPPHKPIHHSFTSILDWRLTGMTRQGAVVQPHTPQFASPTCSATFCTVTLEKVPKCFWTFSSLLSNGGALEWQQEGEKVMKRLYNLDT